ncbi:MAG: hypothetical protein Q8S43_06875 [Actinomycetota bacterium]|nr:MAG: hypothetical protein FD171_389 [Actinomycetota bacterium]MDO8950236.1 hypothetical protein [Actinomycetota bacterium]MDP3630658.1 hypothetical protein [Actinomycetota bacterium]
MRQLSSRTRVTLVALIVGAVIGCVVSVLMTPPDEKLGTMVRFVMFHGASTWVNLLTFTLAGAAGLAFALGSQGVRVWGEAFRWISLPLWVINSILGLLSMQLIWGGILWSEPRLGMTFGVLGGALAIFAVQLIFDAPRVTAALDSLLAGTVWTLVLVLPNLFHPDSPIFQSGNWAFIVPFLGMVATIAIVALSLAVLIARRGSDEPGGIVFGVDPDAPAPVLVGAASFEK